MRRASSAREIGSCSRTRLRRIWRLISRGVHRVARTKLRVLIFLIGGDGEILRSHSGARTLNRRLCSLSEHSCSGHPRTRVRREPESSFKGPDAGENCPTKEQIGARRMASPARLLVSPIPIAMTAAPTFSLHPDRFFDAEPSVRRAARTLYEEMRGLPLICAHGHVDPSLLSEDRAFTEPAALLITPDHYLFRMLYSQGVSMESLRVPTRGPKTATEERARKVVRVTL